MTRARRLLCGATTALLLTAAAVAAAPAARAATVTSLSPTSGRPGSTVTVTGTGFSGTSSVKFTGATATAKVSSSTKLSVVVPAGASTGPVTVSSGGSTGLAAGNFTVTLGLLLSTQVGPPGTRVTLSGAGFGANEAVDVYTGTAAVALVVAGATGTFSLPRFVVPRTTPPGDFWVTAVGRSSGRATQTAFTVRADWPQMGNDASGARAVPDENVITRTSAKTLGRAWVYRAPGAVQSGVSVSGGLAYVQGAGLLYALDATTGAKKWSRTTDNANEFSTPAVSGTTVVVGSSDGGIYAFNALTGDPRWRATMTAGSYASATISGGVVYIASYLGTVYAYDLLTGAVRWSATLGGNVVSSPAVDDGLVFIGCYDGKLYALDAATGAVQWTYTTSGVVEAPPTVVNGTVYVGNDAGIFYAVGAGSGLLAWSANRGAAIYGRAAVADGLVYTGVAGGSVIAADASNGAVQWTAATGNTNPTGPAVGGGVVFVTSYDQRLWAFDATNGARLWSYGLGGGTFGDAPSVVNGVVYQAAENGKIFAFAPRGQVPAATRAAAPERRALGPGLRVVTR